MESLENARRAKTVPVPIGIPIPARKKNRDVIKDAFAGREEILFSEFEAQIRADSVTPVSMDWFDIIQSTMAITKNNVFRMPKRAIEVALHTCCPVGWEEGKDIGEALCTASTRSRSIFFSRLRAPRIGKVVETLKESWFHGFVPAEESEKREGSMTEGSFYIRFSNSNRVNPVIGIHEEQYRIQHTKEGYAISGSKVFSPTLAALCNHWKKRLVFPYPEQIFPYSQEWETKKGP